MAFRRSVRDDELMVVSDPLVHATLLGEALEQGPVAVFVFDEELRYVAVNEYACSLLGYERAELLELRAGALSEPGSMEEYAAVVQQRQAEGRTRVRRKDGEVIPLRFRACETRVAGLTFYVGVAWPE
jgi:PAS domain S-box-containing protein